MIHEHLFMNQASIVARDLVLTDFPAAAAHFLCPLCFVVYSHHPPPTTEFSWQARKKLTLDGNIARKQHQGFLIDT